jgi:hypothetical protein
MTIFLTVGMAYMATMTRKIMVVSLAPQKRNLRGIDRGGRPYTNLNTI